MWKKRRTRRRSSDAPRSVVPPQLYVCLSRICFVLCRVKFLSKCVRVRGRMSQEPPPPTFRTIQTQNKQNQNEEAGCR